MKKLKYFGIGLLFLTLSGWAQNKEMYTLSYEISTGLGDTYDFINKGSFRGFSFDGRKFVTDNISVGGTIGWHVFYENLEGTQINENNAVTGKQFRYINSFPIMATFFYYFDEDPEDKSFYVGTGIGTYNMEKRTDMGLFTSGKPKWHFGMQPTIGMLLPIKEKLKFNFGIKYNHAFKAGDYDKVQYFSVALGLSWW